jgi:N-acetylglucosaminyldiphosphoundecaprenol N-acetyl-beta-D-mannosaminyltransferase
MELKHEHIMNAPVNSARLPDLLDAIEARIAAGVKGTTLFCANPHSLVVAKNDPLFLSALCSADILIPDGAGIVLASRLLGGTIRQRITGSDIMLAMAERWNTIQNRSFFFLGSSAEVLHNMKTRMEHSYPHVAVRGVYAPSFTNEFSADENEHMIETVNRAAPTVLWVGMTAPKQEKWIHQHRHRLDVPLIAAVGAAFDYFAGTKKRASAAIQNIGLEWLPRLLREPRRMWKRSFVSTPMFLYHILHQKYSLPRSAGRDESMKEH